MISHGRFDVISHGRFDVISHGRFDVISHGRFDVISHGRFDVISHGRSHGRFYNHNTQSLNMEHVGNLAEAEDVLSPTIIPLFGLLSPPAKQEETCHFNFETITKGQLMGCYRFPSVIRKVKKETINKNRLFFCCAQEDSCSYSMQLTLTQQRTLSTISPT